jgi:hypothetical protein
VPTMRLTKASPAEAINPKESMGRKAHGRGFQSSSKKPPRAHDAGLITADRRGGGFCINCPKTSPNAIGALREETVPHHAFAKSSIRRVEIAIAGPAKPVARIPQ